MYGRLCTVKACPYVPEYKSREMQGEAKSSTPCFGPSRNMARKVLTFQNLDGGGFTLPLSDLSALALITTPNQVESNPLSSTPFEAEPLALAFDAHWLKWREKHEVHYRNTNWTPKHISKCYVRQMSTRYCYINSKLIFISEIKCYGGTGTLQIVYQTQGISTRDATSLQKHTTLPQCRSAQTLTLQLCHRSTMIPHHTMLLQQQLKLTVCHWYGTI